MRSVVLSISVILALAGCARTPPQRANPWSSPVVPQADPKAAKNPSTSTSPIVTPSNDTVGRVVSVNAKARYAVLSYGLGSVPSIDSRVYSYRGGFKVGELKVTGPARENNTVADVVVGECQAGDEVRRD
jgi:hypothetical protein